MQLTKIYIAFDSNKKRLEFFLFVLIKSKLIKALNFYSNYKFN